MKSRNLSKDKREKLISKILEQMSNVDDDTKAVFREVISELNKKDIYSPNKRRNMGN